MQLVNTVLLMAATVQAHCMSPSTYPSLLPRLHANAEEKKKKSAKH